MGDEETSDHLYDLFYTPSSPCAFSSPENLHREASKQYPSLTLSQVERWLRSQYTYTLHRKTISKFERNKIVVDREGRQWQADLVDLKNISRRNKGIRYLLNCVDVFSRHAIVHPLIDKSSSSVAKAFEEIFKERHPDFLQTDQGREFFGLKDLLGAYGIKHFYATDKNIKCAIAERFNRTLRGRMFKLFTARGDYKYYDVIQDLVKGYNASYHRSIGMAPRDVNKETREKVFRKLYGAKDIIEYYDELYKEKNNKLRKKDGSNLKENDAVRIKHTEQGNAFMKMYYPLWRDRIFKVKKVIKSGERPIYQIDGDIGLSMNKRRGLYKQEVQKVKEETYRVDRILKRDKSSGKVFVSCLDYPAEFNSWIPEAEIQRVKKLTTRR